MKAIQYTAPRQFAVVDLPKPEPGPHQVVILVKACGICKTDLTIHDGSFLAKFPLVNGHEFAGVIDSVGSAVTEWKVGDRVTADNTELCGYCEPCRSDKPLYCENFNSHGCNMPGGFAEYVLINHDKVFALSDKLSFEEATFTEPTACAVHGVDRIAPRFGDSILMFGAGPTGIILAQLLRRAGAGRMVIAWLVTFPAASIVGGLACAVAKVGMWGTIVVAVLAILVALIIIRMSHRNPVNSMNVNERSDVKINADATAAQAA